MIDHGFKVKGSRISYYNAYENAYIYVGKEPMNASDHIPIEDIDLKQRLTLKVRMGPVAEEAPESIH